MWRSVYEYVCSRWPAFSLGRVTSTRKGSSGKGGGVPRWLCFAPLPGDRAHGMEGSVEGNCRHAYVRQVCCRACVGNDYIQFSNTPVLLT